MTSRSRDSLKAYFSEGALPTEDHFSDLVDSMLNMSDEGFRKTVENGFEVYAPIGHDALISFYRDEIPEAPLWGIGFGGARDQLRIDNPAGVRQPDADNTTTPDLQNAPGAPLLCLDLAQRVGIRTETPEAELDVSGAIRSTGRRGAYQRQQPEPLLANGQWQDLSDDLSGCQAFEITAGAGHSGTGRFGMIHAVALNTYNPTLGVFEFLNRRRGIRSTHGYYSRRCDRLELRWLGSHGRDGSYRLQIRTRCNFSSGSPDKTKDDKDKFPIRIQAHVTQLWFDPHMERGQL
jgi:hypothetical protein